MTLSPGDLVLWRDRVCEVEISGFDIHGVECVRLVGVSHAVPVNSCRVIRHPDEGGEEEADS